MSQIRSLKIEDITPNPSLRIPTDTAVDAMAESLAAIGQLSPVGVLEKVEGNLLIYGNTRFLAATSLNWPTLEAKVFPAGTPPETCMRMAISENSVRQQMSFVESYDAIHEYANLCKLPITREGLTQAGKELNFNASQVSKCLGTNERLTTQNKKRLVDAKIAPSLAYLISREEGERQDQLVEAVVSEKWTRKQLEQYFRAKKKGGTRFEYRHERAKLSLEVPRTASQETVLQLLKAFVTELKKCSGLRLETAARVIKEQVNAL